MNSTNKKENPIMENYTPGINMVPIQNIIKSHLVLFQHTHEKLTAPLIDTLALEITETIESFLSKSSK